MKTNCGPELRTDVITGRRVIVAADRSARPNAAQQDPPLRVGFDPFLPGHESHTPAERYVIRNADSIPDGPGWNLRVVPNRYPLLSEGASSHAEVLSEGLFPAVRSSGIHDVVVECPDDRSRLVLLTVEEVVRVLDAWQARTRVMQQDSSIRDIAVFRNEGFSAGASLPHCHSQIVGYHHATPGLSARREAAFEYQQVHGTDLTMDWLAAEMHARDRLVSADSQYAVVCPFAPRGNYHMRVVPRHPALLDFQQLAPSALRRLAEILCDCLQRLEAVLGPASFNILLPIPALASDFCWMLELVPRLSRAAGWELLTEVDVVTTSPEAAAAKLRDCSWHA
jgi:UDPglucose--hexose-1-phosphate uridylyltransferase